MTIGRIHLVSSVVSARGWPSLSYATKGPSNKGRPLSGIISMRAFCRIWKSLLVRGSKNASTARSPRIANKSGLRINGLLYFNALSAVPAGGTQLLENRGGVSGQKHTFVVDVLQFDTSRAVQLISLEQVVQKELVVA